VDRVVYGTGTVIARQAHAHLWHGGPFEACSRCHGSGRLQWLPGSSPGILVHDRRGRLIETGALIGRLLVP
jgi:hypothetical protein